MTAELTVRRRDALGRAGLAARLPEALRRADRDLRPPAWRARPRARVARRRASTAPRRHGAGLVDRHRRRRPRDRLHRQVRARPGTLHGADAADCRGAERAARSRHADPVRHRADARSGDDVGRAVASRELQPRPTSRSPARRRAKRSSRLASTRLGVPADQLVAGDGVVMRQGRSVEARELRRPRRRPEVRSPPRRRPRSGSTPREWTVLGTPVPRLDMPALVTGQLRVRAQRARARACCTAASCGPPSVGATLVTRRRVLGARHARAREGRRQEELRRRRGREAMAGDAGGREAEGHVDAGHRRCPPRSTFHDHLRSDRRRATRCPSTPATSTARCAGAAHGGEGHLSATRTRCTDRSAARAPWPTCRREGHALVGDASRLSDARTPRRWCSASRPTACASCSRAGPAATASTARTPSLRRRADVAGRRQARARPAHAAGRDGVGELRAGLRHRPARRARCQRHDRRVGLRGLVAGARRPARLRQRPATSSPACSPGSRRSRSRRARRLRRRSAPLDNGSNTAPSYVTGCVGADARGAAS